MNTSNNKSGNSGMKKMRRITGNNDVATTSLLKCSRDASKMIATQPGHLRKVVTGNLTPWFYAVGNEELLGDFTVPFILNDHPVYRLVRQFVLVEEHKSGERYETIKTCVGCWTIRWMKPHYGYVSPEEKANQFEHIIYWHDGTATTA